VFDNPFSTGLGRRGASSSETHPNELTPSDVLEAFDKAGYRRFDGPWNLNLFGIRTGLEAGKWDDWIGCLYQNDELEWQLELYQGTTDPSDVWLERGNDLEKGSAIVAELQFLSCWKMGLHRGDYPALCQAGAPKPMTVIRDANRDDVLDVDDDELVIETGWFGINLHRGSAHRSLMDEGIGLYSAGCQVLCDPADYAALWDLIVKSSKSYGQVFSYTLFRWKKNIGV
jgi:hypothetical protein